MILSYYFKLKHQKLDFFYYEGSFQKKNLPDKLETFKTLQKVFPENSSEISRKSGIFLIGLKHFDGPRTVVFYGNMQYFRKIKSINFMKCSQSGKY